MKNDKAKTTKRCIDILNEKHEKRYTETTKPKKQTQKTRNDFVRVSQRATTTRTPKVHGKHMQSSLGRLKGMIFGSATETAQRERESKQSSHETSF